jgi:nucleoside-diphosphate-sugar epimerase
MNRSLHQQAAKRNKPNDALPEVLRSEEELDDVLTRPSPELVRFIASLRSPLVVLGAGGKMGPTLAVLARRAADAAGHSLEVLAVSRFSNAASRAWLEQRGVRTLSVELLDASAIASLPDTENVIYLVGLKFGTAQNPSATWAVNTLVPARVCERYPSARIVALSTGNVYPLSDVKHGGSIESDPLIPLGEYANAAVARERIFEYYSRGQGTALAVLRLYYAVDLRYGVLIDIARKVHAAEPIPLANGAFNCIWQGDANDLILRALALPASPPFVANLCRPELFSVRDVATRLGELLGRAPIFAGHESATALVGNATRLCDALGKPRVSAETMLRWAAHWVSHGGRDLCKPTHFETRDGQY